MNIGKVKKYIDFSVDVETHLLMSYGETQQSICILCWFFFAQHGSTVLDFFMKTRMVWEKLLCLLKRN